MGRKRLVPSERIGLSFNVLDDRTHDAPRGTVLATNNFCFGSKADTSMFA